MLQFRLEFHEILFPMLQLTIGDKPLFEQMLAWFTGVLRHLALMSQREKNWMVLPICERGVNYLTIFEGHLNDIKRSWTADMT